MRRTLSVAWAAGIAGVVVAWSQGCLHKQAEIAPAVEEEALMPATKSGFVPSPPPPPPEEEEAPAEPEPKPEPEE